MLTLLKSVLGQTNDSEIPPLEVGGKIITDNRQKAEVFNDFFTQVSSLDDENAELPQDFINDVVNRLDEIVVTEQDVHDQLKILDTNKAYGPDGIPPRLLKEAAVEITPSLTKLLNASLNQETFPTIWKGANVLPLYKKDDANQRTNYRPVSLLCTLSKVFERIVFKYVYNFFRENFLISIHQFGFLPGHSTVLQLTEIYHHFCKAVSDGKEIRVVFLDIKKAFDRVWHRGLIFKLERCGISGKLLHWFADYLKDRVQRVILKGQYSKWLKIVAGVPQGSVLGPLLFLIFINDLTSVIDFCDIRMFADDTSLFITVDNREEAAVSLNHDLANVQTWADRWLVSFSPPKTESLIISTKTQLDRHPQLSFMGTPIKEVKEHKHLGITLTQSLRWNKHIDEISNKCTKKLDVMKSLKWKIDRKSLETIFNSFVLPCMDYGDVLYAGTYDSDLCKLDKILVDAMRIVTGATARSNIKLLHEETGWPTLTERRTKHVLCSFFKILHDMSPSPILETYNTLVAREQHYALRNMNHIPAPFTRTESYRRSYFPDAIRRWNQLSPTLKENHSFEEFKQLLNMPTIPKQDILYYGDRWASIHHARIRLGCSKLNSHLCNNLHVIPSSTCNCGNEDETPIHFFFTCPLHNEHRAELHNTFIHLTTFTLHTVLYGDNTLSLNENKLLFDAVHTFIKNTNRFIDN